MVSNGVRERLRRPLTGYQGAVVLIVVLTLSAASLFISLRATRISEDRERAARLESERAWCSVLITIDNAAPSNEELAAGIRYLRTRNCPPADPNRPLPSITK
jgi:hypothetical protein